MIGIPKKLCVELIFNLKKYIGVNQAIILQFQLKMIFIFLNSINKFIYFLIFFLINLKIY